MKARTILAFLPALLVATPGVGRAQTLFSNSFTGADNGGFESTNENGASSHLWTHDPATGAWSVEGDDPGPSSNELTSPAINAPAGSALRVTLSHRYSFETEWDGGVIQYSVDGGEYITIPKTDYKLNGYTFDALIGNHVLKDQSAFNGNSSLYSDRFFITTVADIPAPAAAASLRVRLLGAWDEGTRGSLPNWEVDSIRLETLLDTDGDGMPDGWEDTHALDKTVNDAAADADSDGLTNLQEFQKFTNPKAADTDADGYADGVETGTGTFVSATNTGTNPLIPDTDADGLKDGVETATGTFVSTANTGTSPLVADTDGDFVVDGLELKYGSSPVNAASTPIQAGVPSLLAWWDFNDASDPLATADKRVGFKADLAGGTVFTEDAGGASGMPGDRAVTVLTGGAARVEAVSAEFMNIAARADKISIVFWMKRNSFGGASNVFWGYSASAGGNRGIQAHAPWTEGTIYFDSAGCCAANQRISGKHPDESFDYSRWHHFAFIKNEGVKEVWVDGEMILSGPGALPLPADFNGLHIGGGASGGIDGEIDDFAVYGSALSSTDIQRLVDGETPAAIAVSSDADADGLPDSWEYLYFPADLTKLKTGQDFDGDGLKDEGEFTLDANPTLTDTDSDTIPDGAENNSGVFVSLQNRGTNPKKTDTDEDGIQDNVETNTGVFVSAEDPGTSPLKKDTDGDTFPDAVEILYHTNPVLATSRFFTPGETALVAWWDFNSTPDDVIVEDKIVSFPGVLENGAFLNGDGEGRSGAAGDRALALPGRLNVEDGEFLNITVPGDSISIAFWQFRTDTGESSFWAFSPGVAGGDERGLQAHVPFSNNNVYFDSSGCCDTNVSRIFGPLPEGFDAEGPAWHHWVFIKDGAEKTVWLDGDVFLTGTSVALPSSFYKLHIGASNLGGGIGGVVDDFAVYAGGLTEAQIALLAGGAKPDSILTAQPPPASFKVTAFVKNANGSVTLTWESEAGVTYAIEGSANLTQWTPVQSSIAGAAGTTTATVANPPAAPYFLRVTR